MPDWFKKICKKTLADDVGQTAEHLRKAEFPMGLFQVFHLELFQKHKLNNNTVHIVFFTKVFIAVA